MKTLIIPSATLIPKELQSQFGAIPSCLFPLQDRTMLQRLVEKYAGIADEILVVVHEKRQLVYDYVALSKLPVKVVDLPTLGTLGETIAFGFETALKADPTPDAIFVNFADTLLSNQPYDKAADVVYYTEEPFSSDWTYFDHLQGKIENIVDKKALPASSQKRGNVFTGVFEFSDPRRFLSLLNKNLSHGKREIDAFYAGISEYSLTRSFDCVLVGKWYDVGHTQKYFEAKTKVQARAFNTIEIDDNRGILTKRSNNRDKFRKEIQWYLKMPEDLQCFIPRIYRYSLDEKDPFVSMEYYGYTTLHEMFVFGEVPDATWEKIFSRLLFLTKCMREHRVEDRKDAQVAAMRNIYVDKTVARLQDLKKSGVMQAFFEHPILVNGKEYPSLGTCIKNLPDLIAKTLLGSDPEFCVIHGDLCFSNILVENDYGFLRLIDPRGEFGSFDIYGDRRYELAKLFHSMDGGYDFIIEDLFNVQAEGSSILLDMPAKRTRVWELFVSTFAPELGDLPTLKLIESLLFLSMIPLHSDYLNRQYAMLATGLRLLDEATKGDRSWIKPN